MDQISTEDRVAGAILGVFIGDALALAPHWIYDLDRLNAEFGWIDDYHTPRPGSYHDGLAKGSLTQSGELSFYLLNTLAQTGGYDQQHFTNQWDAMLATLSGERKGGKHGWTSKDILDVWRRRVGLGKAFGPETASPSCDTTDSIIRAALIAGRYHREPQTMCALIKQDAAMQYGDRGVITQSICFGAIIRALISGEKIDASLSPKLYQQAQQGILPFSFLRGDRDAEEDLAEPDGLLWFGQVVAAANNPNLGKKIPQPHLAVQFYGLACAYFMVMPSAYYIAGSFPNDFENAVLNSVNAGGQNVARSSLVGALVGATVGINAIPERFISGLRSSEAIVNAAVQVARDSVTDE